MLFDPKKKERLFHHELFVAKGFIFGFHTHVVISNSQEIIFIYDYGYRLVDESVYQLYYAELPEEIMGEEKLC
jgi:hypothetical protein